MRKIATRRSKQGILHSWPISQLLQSLNAKQLAILLSAATIRTRVGWAAIRAACVDVTFVYLLLVESSIGAHVLKSFMADRV